MTKLTPLSLENDGNGENGGANRRRIHLREISGDSDSPAETVGQELRAALLALPGGGDTAAALVDLIGRTDLPTLAAVLARAHAVIANDSGAMHLAGAVGAPVVAVFGPTNEHQTAPLSASVDGPPARLAIHQVWCRPCMLRECPLGHVCMLGVSAADVAALVP